MGSYDTICEYMASKWFSRKIWRGEEGNEIVVHANRLVLYYNNKKKKVGSLLLSWKLFIFFFFFIFSICLLISYMLHKVYSIWNETSPMADFIRKCVQSFKVVSTTQSQLHFWKVSEVNIEEQLAVTHSGHDDGSHPVWLLICYLHFVVSYFYKISQICKKAVGEVVCTSVYTPWAVHCS